MAVLFVLMVTPLIGASVGEAQCSPEQLGKRVSQGTSERRYWPLAPTFQWGRAAAKGRQRGSAGVRRSGLATIERVFSQNGIRQAAANDTPAFIWAHLQGLDLDLPLKSQATRYSLCVGLIGVMNKRLLRSNLDFFESTMGRGPHASFLARTYSIPNDIHRLTREYSGWVVVRRSDTHNAETLRVGHTQDIKGILEIPRINEVKGKKGKSSAAQDWIAIEYIKPHLWDGKKWDFRVHVLITGMDPMRVWLAGAPLAITRTALKQFSFDDLSIAVHTTNAVDGGDYGEGGHTRGLEEAKHLFSEEAFQSIWKQVERIVLLTLVAVEPQMRHGSKKRLSYSEQCFEILAHDFIINENGRVFLLEVNRNFALGYFTAKNGVIKSKLYSDMLCLIGASCSRATRAPVEPIPEEEQPFLQPFEQDPNVLERLADDHRRALARSSRTEFQLIWPPPPHLEDVARDVERTEEWYPSYFTKFLWSRNSSSPLY